MQFAEVDSARIVHFSRYFRYMEEAEHALWRDAGLSIAPSEANSGYARIAASFEYHRPLCFEDEFDVHIRIVAITPKTLRYACTVTRDGERVATGAMAVVHVTGGPGQTMRSLPIPPEIAARFAVAADDARPS